MDEAHYLPSIVTLLRRGYTLYRTHTYTNVGHTQKFTAPGGNQTAVGSANVGQLTDGWTTSTNVYGQIGSRRDTHTLTHTRTHTQIIMVLFPSFHNNMKIRRKRHKHNVNKQDGLIIRWLRPDWSGETQQPGELRVVITSALSFKTVSSIIRSMETDGSTCYYTLTHSCLSCAHIDISCWPAATLRAVAHRSVELVRLNTAIGCQLVALGCARHEMSGVLVYLLKDPSSYFVPLVCVCLTYLWGPCRLGQQPARVQWKKNEGLCDSSPSSVSISLQQAPYSKSLTYRFL